MAAQTPMEALPPLKAALHAADSGDADAATPMDVGAKLEGGHHPYGVQPEGNMWLDMLGPNRMPPAKATGLGKFLNKLKDDQLLEIFSFLNGSDLAAASTVSRAFYVFTHHDDLWRTLTLTQYGSKFAYGEKTWHETYVRMQQARKGGVVVPHKPICVPAFYSDLLFQGWFCASARVDSSWLTTETIERRAVEDLSLEQFVEEFELPNRPLIITGCAKNWPACREWNPESLSKIAGDATLDAGGFPFSIKDYFQYASSVHDDQPLYLFDKNFAAKVPELGAAYSVPEYFAQDLFSVLGDKRPDYRWIIMGPKKSGSVFHKDPNATCAWNACITGAKKWIMFPPDMCPPGVHASADGSEVATPVSVMEWMLDFYDAAAKERKAYEADWRARKGIGGSTRPAKRHRPNGSSATGPVRLKRQISRNSCSAKLTGTACQDAVDHDGEYYMGPVEGISRAGDVVFVPRGWWHLVLNIDDSIAITQNYVSSANLPHVLTFLRDMKYAISGVDPAAADGLYDAFVEALETQKPDALHRAQAQMGETSPVGTEVADKPAVAEINQRWSQFLKSSTVSNASGAPEGGFSFGFTMDG